MDFGNFNFQPANLQAQRCAWRELPDFGGEKSLALINFPFNEALVFDSAAVDEIARGMYG